MSKASEYGKSFMAGVLAKLPEEKRAQVEAIFNDPTAEDALVVVGTGALAQPDINKRYDDLKAKEAALTDDYTKLTAWYEDNKGKLDEYAELKAHVGSGGSAPPKPDTSTFDPSKFIDQKTFEIEMRHQQMAAANYLGLQTALTLSHYRDFGEVLDTRELLADKRLGTQLPDGRLFGLQDAYTQKFADKITERDKAREDARIKKLVDERLAEERKALPAQAFPIKGAPSPLDVLDPTSATKPEQYTVDSAVAEYQRLQEARQTA